MEWLGQQDSRSPWVLPPNSIKCSRPNTNDSGLVGDESQGVWEEDDKEPWKSTIGKKSHLRCLNEAAAVLRGAEV